MKGDMVKVGKHHFSPVLLGKGHETLAMFSRREIAFMHKFLTTMNLDEACGEIGVEREAGRRLLRRGKVKAFVQEQLREAALASGVSVQNHLAWLKGVRDGVESVSQTQIEAAKIIGRFLRPEGGGTKVQVNTQVNVVGSVGPSPYSDLTAEQLEREMRNRVESGAFENRPSGAA